MVLPPPAATLEGREDQLILAAYDLVEKRIARGDASAQETTHFLKAGSRFNRAQMDKLEHENEVLRARVKQMEQMASQEDLLEKALRAFKGYSGQVDPNEMGDGDDYQDIQ